jgi:hypothetical protein
MEFGYRRIGSHLASTTQKNKLGDYQAILKAVAGRGCGSVKAREMKKLSRLCSLFLALVLLGLPCGRLEGDNDAPKAIELWLSHYKAGNLADPLLNEPKLLSCPRFDYPDQPWNQSRTDYFLPTGNVVVCTTLLKDERSQSYRCVLSQAPFFVPESTSVSERVKQYDQAMRIRFPVGKNAVPNKSN